MEMDPEMGGFGTFLGKWAFFYTGVWGEAPFVFATHKGFFFVRRAPAKIKETGVFW